MKLILATLLLTLATPMAAVDFGQQNHPRPWAGERILHIGDSHLANWGFKSTLRHNFRAAGAIYMAKPWKGSNSRAWIVSGRLGHLLKKKHPTVVVVSLGTNALKYPDPDKWATWITKMVKRIGPRECYWIAPPPVLEDRHGYYDMLAKTATPCHLFDSRTVPFPHKHRTHFHLSKEESILWANQFWQWINQTADPAQHHQHGI